jgi:hypothetical protein
MRIADESELSWPGAGQTARPLRAFTEAGLVSKGLPLTCTIGPGRSVVLRLFKPSKLLSNLLPTILSSPGEHVRPDVVLLKLGMAVPVTTIELGWPCGEAKFQNLVRP